MSKRNQDGGMLTSWLENAPAPLFAAYAITAAFSTYFCMYAFRKPFAAAKFEGEFFLNSAVALKTAIVISQIIGYALSKYIGIKVCSEVSPTRRAITLAALIAWAELALVAYGLHFLPLFLLAVWMLNQLPRASASDVAARSARNTMTGADRLAFVRQFLFGMILLCVAYFFLTAYRDFRDNYQVEIFDGLGYPYAQNKAIISKTETLVAFGVMAALALLAFIQDNRRGLLGAFSIMTGGVLLLGLGTILFQAHVINGFWWMTLTGLGSYLACVPFGSVFFDRLIASTRAAGTAVFAIYLADAIGYTGSVGVQLFKDLSHREMSRLGFFKGFSHFVCVVGVTCMITSCIYFRHRHRQQSCDSAGPSPPAVPEIGEMDLDNRR